MPPVVFSKTLVAELSSTILLQKMYSKKRIKYLLYCQYKLQETFVIKYALNPTMKRKKKLTSQPIKQAKLDQQSSLYHFIFSILPYIFIAPKRKIIIKIPRSPPDLFAITIKNVGIYFLIKLTKIKITNTTYIKPVFPNTDLHSAANKLNDNLPFYIFSTVHERALTAHHFGHQISLQAVDTHQYLNTLLPR